MQDSYDTMELGGLRRARRLNSGSSPSHRALQTSGKGTGASGKGSGSVDPEFTTVCVETEEIEDIDDFFECGCCSQENEGEGWPDFCAGPRTAPVLPINECDANALVYCDAESGSGSGSEKETKTETESETETETEGIGKRGKRKGDGNRFRRTAGVNAFGGDVQSNVTVNVVAGSGSRKGKGSSRVPTVAVCVVGENEMPTTKCVNLNEPLEDELIQCGECNEVVPDRRFRFI